MLKLLPTILFLTLVGCNTTSHEMRSLMCLGFCTEQQMEHKADPNAVKTKDTEKDSQ